MFNLKSCKDEKKSSTFIDQAYQKVPGFRQMYDSLRQQVRLNGYSASTLHNYGRSIAKIALFSGCTPLERDDEQGA